MSPRQLQAFVAVAQLLSFAQASERLHMSQPALSLAIRNLEEELGGPLFSRTTRQVGLTPEGQALLPQAIRLLTDFDNVRERLVQRFALQKGHLTIAAMPSFCSAVLPSILREYRRNYPAIELSLQDVVNEQVAEIVQTGRVELGIGFEPQGENGLVFEPLFVDRFIAIVAADSPLATEESVTWARLLENDFISLQRPSSMRRLLEDSVRSAGMELQVALECHQLATVNRLVAAGLGVSVVPSMLREQLQDMGVQGLRLERPQVRQPIGIIYRRDQQLSAAASAMRETMSRQSFTDKHR